jgi:hypothetical protein
MDAKTLGPYDPFDISNGRKVRFKKPSVGDSEKANLLAAEYAAKLLREQKLLVRQEIQAMLDAKQDSADIIKARITNTFNRLKSLEEEYEQVADPEQKDAISTEIQKMQMGILENISNVFDIFNVSVESQVEKYRRFAMLHLSTLNDDGTLYWPTIQDLENEEDIESYNLIALRFSELQGTFTLTDEQRYAMQQLLSTTPENLEAILDEGNT